MANFKIVTTGPGNTDHSLEMETLGPIGAEIVEVNGRRGRAGQGRGRCRRDLRQGPAAHHRQGDRGRQEAEGRVAGQRRRRFGRRRCRDRARHSGDQLPRHLHRGGGRPRHDPDPGELAPARRAGPDGAQGRMGQGAADALPVPAPDGHDPGLHLVRPCRARRRQARRALRLPDAGLRSLHRGAGDERPRRAAGRLRRAAAALRHHLHARARHQGRPSPDEGAALQEDEEDGAVREHRPRLDGRRGAR